MTQHKMEMSAQKNSDNGGQTESNPPPIQPETSNKISGYSMIDNPSKFKNFSPVPFKEVNNLTEAEKLMDNLKGILVVLKTEEEDKIPFTEFLL